VTRHQTEPLWTDVGRMDIFDEDGRWTVAVWMGVTDGTYAIDLPGDEDFKRGHVIDIRDDDEEVGSEVVNGALMPDGSRAFLWRVVNVPGTKAAYEAMLARDAKRDGELKIVPARRNKIDIDALETAALLKGGKLDFVDAITATKAEFDVLVSVELTRDAGVFLPPEEPR